MKAKEFIPASKPRNFVAKNQKTAGAGAHKDKKRAEKQGDVKHKGKQFDEGVTEVSKSTIDRYVAKASDAHGHADFAARMSKDDPNLRSYHKDQKRTAEKRRQGIGRALDRMSREESIEEYGDTAKGQKMLTKVQKRAVDRMIKADDKRDAKAAKKNQDTANRAWDRMTGLDEARMSTAVKLQRAWERQQAKSAASRERGKELLNPSKKEEPKKQNVAERVRDPEDWDEGNTEPANNFAVYINGKKWKVFKGRGYYADDYREKQHYQQLKAWAEKKSAETGKKWTVSVTGEEPTA